MTISKLNDSELPEFEKLFCDYFAELDCDEDAYHLLNEYLLPDLKANLLSVAVAKDCGKLYGFVIFQIDDVINDWCFLEGKGDIREIYVAPDCRRQGVGKALLLFAENALNADEAKEIYTLPTDECEKFFSSCGYCDIGEYCAELDCKVFGKNF